MASITDHVIKLQELTQQNLEILQTINDSFYTKQNHLAVSMGDNQYYIPSFISLENKINLLSANFENLIAAPLSGEAFFNMDGNSRSIEVRSYNTTPPHLTLNEVVNFGIDQNDVFKDFVTPVPYVNFNIQSIPNDITEVIVKKIIPTNPDLLNYFITSLEDKSSKQLAYKDLYKVLDLYTQDVDYIEYDTTVSLPIRKSLGNGLYVIERIIEDVVDDNLDNYITLKIRNDIQDPNYLNTLYYRLFDETIERPLKVGDQLVTFEGNAKLELVEVKSASNVIKVKVLHGEYLNLVESNTNDVKNISSLSKLCFYSPISFDEDKYVRVPLEEDPYIYVAIASLNSRMNIQSSWGTGVLINTFSLKNDNVSFKEYYKNNVRNIGDILYEISAMMSNTLTKYTIDEYKDIVSEMPNIKESDLLVTQINKHIEDSPTVKSIRSIYNQKKDYHAKIDEIQTEINTIEDKLSTIDYSDTTGARLSLENALNSLKTQKNSYSGNLTKLLNEMTNTVNNSEVPIENAKYRIRGYFDCSSLKYKDLVKGIRVQYRYKNHSQTQGSALTINDKFVFSDWNTMDSFDKVHIVDIQDDKMVFSLQNNNDEMNEPSFNQIDIPISQGETVDIRLKVVYDLGAPFVQVVSPWSPIINIAFPETFLKNTPILDIIEENNSDIEKNRFNNILNDEGVSEHTNDKMIDQDVVYYHKPENIASGFYTEERRVIPLKDKLVELSNIISQMKDEIYSNNGDTLSVSIELDSSKYTIPANQSVKLITTAYSNLSGTGEKLTGAYTIEDGTAKTVAYIVIKNNSTTTAVKLHSIFPGDAATIINKLTYSKFNTNDYSHTQTGGDDGPVYKGVYYETVDPSNGNLVSYLQHCNQFLYFRINNLYTGAKYYDEGDQSDIDNKLSWDGDYYKRPGPGSSINVKTNKHMYLYPSLSTQDSLNVDSKIGGSYYNLSPLAEIKIPIMIEFKCSTGAPLISKTMSFDLMPSLYKDPINYTFTITAKYHNTTQDQMMIAGQQQLSTSIPINFV